MSVTLDSLDVYNHDNYVAGTPHDAFKLLRDEQPVYWHEHPDGGGFWCITRHADVMKVSRDWKRFSANKGFVVIDDLEPAILERAQGQLLGMDPPKHGPIRRVVIERFTSKRMKDLEPRIRAIAHEILDKAMELSECDFVYDIAGNLPTSVIGSLLGVPEDMWMTLRDWSDLQTSSDDPEISSGSEETQSASESMGLYGYELACERRKNPQDDIISDLVNVEIDGHKVDEAEFASLFVQITVAGNETTRGLLAGGMHQLLKQPELYRELEQNPERLPKAIEEMLRWTTPLHYFRRTATEDVEMEGQTIKAGDRVIMWYSSANFDERVFDDPHTFNINRDPNPHMAFGHGIHLCLGANLARMETRIFFEEFFKRFKGIEQVGDAKRIRSNLNNGLKYLPVHIQQR